MGCLSLNSSHGRIISLALRLVLVALPLVGLVAPQRALAACSQALGAPVVTLGPLQTLGTTPVTANLALSAGRGYLIEVRERDNDALIEALDANGRVIARTDHPEQRTGTRRVVVTAPQSGYLALRIIGTEYAKAVGTATVRAFDLNAGIPSACLALFNALSAADASYAVGQDITSGRAPAAGRNAHDAFVRAAEGYANAERALTEPGDRELRGETQLALAALNVFNLAEWPKAEEWARAAESTFGPADPYRQARAQTLLAYVWIQIGQSESVRQGARLLGEARALLQQTSRFHRRRGSEHDLALQTIYVSLTYMYQGDYPQCVTYASAAARQFEGLHDTAEAAAAWQNRAVCLWGLGHLSDARDDFLRLLDVVDPQIAENYLAILTNAGLLDLALGKYDESLRIYHRGLAMAETTQREFDQARCLHGIGVNYRLLGDPERARGYLERALVIRTPARDGRGRMDSLRQLAVVDAAQGYPAQAVGHDREALSLAVDPLASESIRVQLASHTAAAGDPEMGRALLDEVLRSGPRGDPIILAQALVQRAVILRGMGLTEDALADLGRAERSFRALGNVNGEFATSLELARTLRVAARTSEALDAIERALMHGDAVRLQSVNPDFRTQLEAPLRDAYDLKIELLRAQYEAAGAAGHPTQAASLAARAFSAADSSRAQTFSEVAAQQYSPALRRELASDLRQREAIYRQLAERRVMLDWLTDVSPATNPRARHLLTDIAELQRQADTVNTAIAARVSRSGESKTARRRPGAPSIPPGTALISFWLGAESSYAWVVSAGETHWARLAAPTLIDRAASNLRNSLGRFADQPKSQRLADAARLSELVVRPLEAWLTAAALWVIVPDGALDYVPFAALPLTGNPDSFVVRQHDVALTPAVWRLGNPDTAPPATQRELLLVADPVYDPDDPRLAALPRTPSPQGAPPAPSSAGSARYRRLPYTAREAEAIRREFPPAEVEQLMGLDATRERLLAEDLGKYRFIDIAAHGMVDTRVPELSALVLGSYDASGRVVDGAVRVPDFALLTLHAELVVFSACDTAVGKEAASEGLVGIGSTVLARGARAVVSSLWQVSDEMGARLMTELYEHLMRDSMSAPAALAAAMRDVLSRQPDADPALWAAYQVSVVALPGGRPGHGGGSNISTQTR